MAELKPVYLVCGDDDAKIDAWRTRLRRRAEDEHGAGALGALDAQRPGRHGHRHPGAVDPLGPRRRAPTGGGAGAHAVGQRRPVLGAQPEHLVDRAAPRLPGVHAHQLLGGPVEVGDPPGRVDRHQRLPHSRHHRLEPPPQARLGERLLLHRGGHRVDGRAEHAHLVVALDAGPRPQVSPLDGLGHGREAAQPGADAPSDHGGQEQRQDAAHQGDEEQAAEQRVPSGLHQGRRGGRHHGQHRALVGRAHRSHGHEAGAYHRRGPPAVVEGGAHHGRDRAG